jgi:hypothetical protein
VSTTLGTLSVHLTPDPAEIKVEEFGIHSWIRLGPVTLHTDSSSPDALRAMAAILLAHADRQESADQERAA